MFESFEIKWLFTGLARRIFPLFLAMSLLPLLLFGSHVLFTLHKETNDHANELLMTEAEDITSSINHHLTQFNSTIRVLAQSSLIRELLEYRYHNQSLDQIVDSLSIEDKINGSLYPSLLGSSVLYNEVLEYFTKVIDNNLEIDLIRIFYNDGNILCGVTREGPNLIDYKGDLAWFDTIFNQKDVDEGGYYISSPSISRRLNSSTIRYATPYDTDGVRVGCLIVNFAGKDIISPINELEIELNSFSMIIDTHYENAEGEILGEVFIANSFDPSIAFDETTAGDIFLLKGDFPNDEGVFNFYVYETEWRMAYKKVEVQNHEYVVIVALEESEIIQPIINFLLVQLITIFLIAVIIIILSTFFILYASAPLRYLTEEVKNIGKGDFSGEIPFQTYNNEIGDLARAFTEMKTDLQEYRKTILEEKSLIESIIETTPDGILVLDNEAKVLLFNKTFSKMYRDIFQLQVPKMIDLQEDEQNPLLREISELLRTEDTMPIVIEPRKSFFIQINLRKVSLQSDKSFEKIITCRDITSFIEYDDLRKKFISTISHELRTPITAITSSINLILKYQQKLEEDQKVELREIIASNADILSKLIEDILMISKIEDRGYSIEWKAFQPLKIINEVINTLMAQLDLKKIEIEVDVDDKISLHGDANRIGQIFRIILDNALKYSPDNSKISFTATSGYRGDKNPRDVEGVLFTIQDQGRGIDQKDLHHIFDRFYRVDEVRDTEVPGTGLGLSIAHELITLHDGIVFVESTLGKGSTFFIFLPNLDQKPKISSNPVD